MQMVQRIPRRFRIPLAAASVLAVAAALQLGGANPAESQTTQLVAWTAESDPGLDPASPAWARSTGVQVPLVGQTGTYFAASSEMIPTLTAQALQYDGTLYVRVEWADDTQDDTATRVQDFADGAALEFPARAANTVPSICMGQADAGVNIWHWRADSEQGPQDPRAIYVNTLSDGSPVNFYTAREAGNPYAQTDAPAVQNLVAQAFGTLSTSGVQDVAGHGVYSNGRWSVVFARQFERGGNGLVSFDDAQKTDMAFAVWNGSEGQRNGNKSISQFVTLSLPHGIAQQKDSHAWAIGGAAAILVGVTVLGFGLAIFGSSEKGR